MADRVHPGGESPVRPSADPKLPASKTSSTRTPPPGTYVVQLPKDQIYRYPQPIEGNRHPYLRPKRRRSCCCRFFCCIICFLTLLIILLGAAAAAFYFIVRPELPEYSLNSISISGFNFSSAARAAAISPAINVSVRAFNPNDKIRIHYLTGSAVTVYYDGVRLCNGKMPAFRQPSNNVTVFQTPLKGSSRLVLGTAARTALVRQQKEGKVPLNIKLRAPVKIQVGAVKTWEITVKVSCDVTVNSLTANSTILSKDCGVGVKVW